MGRKSYFGYKLHSIIAGIMSQSEDPKRPLITYLLSVDLSEKMKWFTEAEDTLEQNQKIMVQQ